MKFLFVCFCLLSQSLATADVKYNNKDDAGLFCYAIGGLLHGDKRLEKCIPGLLRGRESPFNWKPKVLHAKLLLPWRVHSVGFHPCQTPRHGFFLCSC